MAKRKFPEALKVTLAFVITAVLLVVFMLLAANIGGIKVTFSQMFRGLFIEYDEDVAIIVQLRFPRIFVAILGGMAMAAAGVITQAVMKSPLADPGIIGISAGSQFVAVLVTAIADGETMMSVVLRSGVFMGHTEIERVVLGENIDHIGVGAFADCSALTSVEGLENASFGAFAFRGCALTGEITVASTMTEIPTYAFQNCASLTKVDLPAALTSIGASAFSGAGLTEVTIPSSVTAIGASAFFETALTAVTIPASVTSLAENSFSGCTQLTSASILANITALPNSTFSGCTSLTTVNSTQEGTADLSAYTEVGNSVLMNTAVETLKLSSSLTETGSSAFSNCEQLVSVDFNGCTGVDFGNQTFMDSTALTSVAVPANSELGSSMFSGCSTLQTVTLGEGITEISGNCFQDCVSLESIVIPASVTTMGTNSFNGCSSLTSVTLEEGVEKLNNYVFRDCTSLTSLILPVSLTETTSTAFSYSEIEVYYYAGTAEQLAASSIASTAKNSAYTYLEEAPINDGSFWHYVEGVPTIWPMV